MWTVRRITCVLTSGAGFRAATAVAELGEDRSENPARPAASKAATAPTIRVCVFGMFGPPVVGVGGHCAQLIVRSFPTVGKGLAKASALSPSPSDLFTGRDQASRHGKSNQWTADTE
jgi:hypothetical protein